MLVPMIAMMLMAPAQAQSTQTSGATPAPAPPEASKVICRRFDVTGSMVRKRKVCYTKAEWAKVNELDQYGARRFVEDNTGRPPGGP